MGWELDEIKGCSKVEAKAFADRKKRPSRKPKAAQKKKRRK